ncbi:hypothetical protein [Kitasatospora phosalacinea]|uniref:Radical SAM protein n=1 Tax=Kitasatospora phosalacinea TaxID=2065 RepID=A0A9W6PLG8_9ACTN|nr:hypothetical protein [Kitasatospora phosalacinea]GLW58539.1 hypothetical protein Kpho01_65500 [Kitasatospora phosalacinea]
MPDQSTPLIEQRFEKVVDTHDTWGVLNPMQGCVARCGYCYLTDLGLTGTRPVELATPAETVRLLRAHPHYRPDKPYALYTCTDALATPANREHLLDLLRALVATKVRNPVVVITKFHVPDDVIDQIYAARAAGLPVVVYLSYSGLSRDVEKGVHHGRLRDNFPRLHAARIPVVHYWRPALPQNSDPESMAWMLDWAARWAECSVTVGLKVKPTARQQAADLWPALAEPGLDLHGAESIWPAPARDFFAAVPERYAHHPIYETNSCALAYVLGRTDRANVYGTPTCTDANHCPVGQRGRCTVALALREPLTDNELRAELVRSGLGHLPYTWDASSHTLTLDSPVEMRDQHHLAQALAVTVRAPRAEGDPMWSGKAAGGRLLVIPTTTGREPSCEN